MRLTAGKIYFWGAFTIVSLTVWNRMSTNNLRTIVDNIKEEKMKEAEQLRQYQRRPGDAASAGQPQQQQMMPSHFNPYYKQQQQENAEHK